MTNVICHHDVAKLPARSTNTVPVLLYGVAERDRFAAIGHAALANLRRLPTLPSVVAFDFLSLALAVTAADTFVDRSMSPNRWCRTINLFLPMHQPGPWTQVLPIIERALHFLSGDIWSIHVSDSGIPPPNVSTRQTSYSVDIPATTDCVCLFSGGLDSTIGVLDLLAQDGSPLLVSHSYQGDSQIQESVLRFLTVQPSRFRANLHPVNLLSASTDITMRARSFNFLALAAIAASVVAERSGTRVVNAVVPENGFIALNTPLTPRRVGSLSTRTTHPFFLALMQQVFDHVGMGMAIVNPYSFKTKGEMFRECLDSATLRSAASSTMSCSNWKRKRMACGRCVPCIIRRASFLAAGVSDDSRYDVNDLASIVDTPQADDLLAVQIAISRAELEPGRALASRSGPLPPDVNVRIEYDAVVSRGLFEMKQLLRSHGVT